MKGFFIGIAAMVTGLALAACAGSAITAASAVGAAETGVELVGIAKDAYCSLAPEGRAEFRAKHHIPHLIVCAGDPVALPPHDPG